MTRCAILGATGYSALEVIKILLTHPEAQITAVTSRQEERPRIDEVHPSLTGRIGLHCEPQDIAALAEKADVAFCCLPHGVTTEAVPALLQAGLKVVDLSADYRLKDPAVYAQWYGLTHGDPDRLPDAVYGLPELFREEIQGASLVANPGCYPTASVLPLAPLIKEGLIEPEGIIIDAKSGTSGAGRTPKISSLYCEVNESLAAYNVGRHRHTPEIEQVLSTYGMRATDVIFTPHLVPMDRGILATCYAQPTAGTTEEMLFECLEAQYNSSPFVHVVEHLPSTKETSHSNRCHITARMVRGRVMTISTLDNLIKGAAGAAVQNFNIVYGYDEGLGLPQ